HDALELAWRDAVLRAQHVLVLPGELPPKVLPLELAAVGRLRGGQRSGDLRRPRARPLADGRLEHALVLLPHELGVNARLPGGVGDLPQRLGQLGEVDGGVVAGGLEHAEALLDVHAPRVVVVVDEVQRLLATLERLRLAGVAHRRDALEGPPGHVAGHGRAQRPAVALLVGTLGEARDVGAALHALVEAVLLARGQVEVADRGGTGDGGPDVGHPAGLRDRHVRPAAALASLVAVVVAAAPPRHPPAVRGSSGAVRSPRTARTAAPGAVGPHRARRPC